MVSNGLRENFKRIQRSLSRKHFVENRIKVDHFAQLRTIPLYSINCYPKFKTYIFGKRIADVYILKIFSYSMIW